MKNIIGIFFSVFVVIATTAAFKITPRIVRGEPAGLGEFPYFAYLDIRSFGFAQSACGASLINDEWLITAAHCVHRTVEINAHLGENVLNKTNPEHIVQTLYSENVHVNPDFDYETANNDIALIRLPQKVKLSSIIQPVDLPKSCKKSENVEVVAVGYGYTSNESKDISDQLNYVFLKTIPLSDCAKVFPNIGDRKTFVCAKGSTARKESICNGDSGGPLVTVDDKTLIATASFTVPAGCETGAPMAFTSVYSHLAWIKKLTGLDLPSC